MNISNFKVGTLTCAACAKIVKKRLLDTIEGIESIDVSLDGDVTIDSADLVTETMIREALKNTDFKLISDNRTTEKI